MSEENKEVVRISLPNIQPEADGIIVWRLIGSKDLRNFDPFLLIDHFEATKPNGYPDHPHRGHEIITYLIEGAFTFEDFKGSHGEIQPGDLLWLTAGRGLVHAEMPLTDRVEGFAIWINLQSSDKLCEFSSQFKSSNEISKYQQNGVEVSVLAGDSHEIHSDICTKTPTCFLDINMNEDSLFRQRIEPGWNSFVYVLYGSIEIKDKQIEGSQVGFLDSEKEFVEIKAREESRVFLFAGKPIGENVAKRGPFVMNSHNEVQEAIQDFEFERNGFEGGKSWASTIANKRNW